MLDDLTCRKSQPLAAVVIKIVTISKKCYYNSKMQFIKQ